MASLVCRARRDNDDEIVFERPFRDNEPLPAAGMTVTLDRIPKLGGSEYSVKFRIENVDLNYDNDFFLDVVTITARRLR